MLEKFSKYMLGSGENNVGGLTPWENIGFLQKLGMGLGGAGVVDNYQRSVQDARQVAAEQAQKSRLIELAQAGDPRAMMQAGATTPEGLAKYAEYLNSQRKPTVPLTSGLPEGYMWSNGQAVKIPGVEVAGKPQSPEAKLAADLRAGLIDEDTYKRAIAKQVAPTEKTYKQFQLQAASFADRMSTAEAMLEPIESGGGDVVNEFSRGLSAIPSLGLGKTLGNIALNPEQQQYKNAASEWIRAKLRKESGAAIPDKEMDEEYRTYFPMVGDSPAVIKQKAALRKNNTASMIKQASGAYEDQYLGEAANPGNTPASSGWSIREKK